MFTRRSLLVLAVLLFAGTLHAQIQVRLDIPRHVYLAYEPMVVTISITNLAGRDVVLQDSGNDRWFGFQIQSGEDTLIGPRDPNYHLSPLVIPAGRTVKRKLDLLQLYPVNEYAQYRINASIFFAGANRYFSSNSMSVLVTDGRLVWEQTVGVPAGVQGAGSNRKYTLLAFRQPKDDMLYARIEDPDAGMIYGTIPLGRLLTTDEPQAVLDRQNQLHVMELIEPKTYLCSTLGLNGEMVEQKTYTTLRVPPKLVKSDTGDVIVKGGQPVVEPTQQANATPPPKLSDRPPGMPME